MVAIGLYITQTYDGKSIDSGGGAGFIGIILIFIALPILTGSIASLLTLKQEAKVRIKFMLAMIGVGFPGFSFIFGPLAIYLGYLLKQDSKLSKPGSNVNKLAIASIVLGCIKTLSFFF